jgi:hypothetical protein
MSKDAAPEGASKGGSTRGPLILSAATGDGVAELLRALLGYINTAKVTSEPVAVGAPAWQP